MSPIYQTKNLWRGLSLSIVLGSLCFFAWYGLYLKSLRGSVDSVCTAINPYLQIGSSRWAEDLAKGSLSLSHPELTASVRQEQFSTPLAKKEVVWKTIPCAVSGRAADSFIFELNKNSGFQIWLGKHLLFFVAIIGLGLGLLLLTAQVSSALFMRQLTSAFAHHFEASKNRETDSFLVRKFVSIIESFPQLRSAKDTILELTGRLHREVSNSAELEFELNQRRFFSKYIHDIRSPLSALKIIFQKRSGAFSEDENGLLRLTFLRLDEISQDVLSSEKSAIQKSLNIKQRLNIEDLDSLLEIIVKRASISFGESCQVKLITNRVEHSTGALQLTVIELDRLLTNLIHNGKEADARHIEVAAQMIGQDIEIKISDDGRGGLGSDLRPKRGPTELKMNSGYGLGLEIVTDLLNRGAGTVEVVSEIGLGSQILIRLPISTHA